MNDVGEPQGQEFTYDLHAPAEQAAAWAEYGAEERPVFDDDDAKRQAVDELVALLVSVGISDPMSVDKDSVDLSAVETEDREVAERALGWYLELTAELDASEAPKTDVDRIAPLLTSEVPVLHPNAVDLRVNLEDLQPPDEFFREEVVDE